MFRIYKHLFCESAKVVFTNIFAPISCNDTLLSLQIVISSMHALISTKEGDCNCPDCKGTIVIIWDLRALLPILGIPQRTEKHQIWLLFRKKCSSLPLI